MKPKYFHHHVGLNSRLDALQAAVLLVKIEHLDGWSAARQENAKFYDDAFADAGAATSAVSLEEGGLPLRTPHPAPGGARHIYNQYVLRVAADHRELLVDVRRLDDRVRRGVVLAGEVVAVRRGVLLLLGFRLRLAFR